MSLKIEYVILENRTNRFTSFVIHVCTQNDLFFEIIELICLRSYQIVHYSSKMSVTDANLPCPQPQASEHLAAAELMNINDVIVLQSKTDFVKDPDIKEHYSQIQEFIKGTRVLFRAELIVCPFLTNKVSTFYPLFKN